MCNDITKDHLEVMSNILGEQSNKFITKLIIPSNIKSDLLSQLHTMNITANSLFPGVDGFGRSIDEYVRLRIYHQKDIL